MGVSTQASFDATGFKSGVNQAQAALKTLDAALKTNEASFKAGGNAEIYMQQKTQLLNDKMAQQQKLVKQLQAGLEQMRANGINPAATEYQRLETQMLNAQTAMLETQSAINGLDESQQKAAGSAGTLADSVNSIGKRVSLDQVIQSIDKITSGMETAARKAVELGRNLWNSIRGGAENADDIASQANILGMDIEDYQRYAKVFSTTAEMTVQDWKNAKQKVNDAIFAPSSEQTTVLEALGIVTHEGGGTGKYGSVIEGAARNYEDVFWEIGETLRKKVASGELSQGLADEYAKSIFGKNWSVFNNIFDMGREKFEEELQSQQIVSEDTINTLADLNDKYNTLISDWESLKMEVMGGIAPALTEAATVLDSLLGKLNEYLKSEKGQEMLEKMGEAVGRMFEGLGNIDPEDAISKMGSVFDTLTDGFEWIANNWGDVEKGLLAIAGAIGGMHVASSVLTFMQLIASGKFLFGGGGTAAAAAEATTTGGGGGIVRNALRAGSKLAQKIYAADPSGTTALIAPYLEDHTRFGQTLRDGGTLQEAAQNSMAEIQKYFTETLPNNWNNFWETSYWGELINGYKNAFEQTVQNFDQYMDQKSASKSSILGEPGQLITEWENLFGEETVDVPTEPEVPENAAESIAEQIGTITVPAQVVLSGAGYGGSTGGGVFSLLRDAYDTLLGHRSYANGLPFAPWDGLAYIHQGERILPAETNRSYTANSYMHIEHMNMHSGLDAQSLASAMRAENQRIISGYGG